MSDFEREIRDEMKTNKQKAEHIKRSEVVEVIKSQRQYMNKSMHDSKLNKS